MSFGTLRDLFVQRLLDMHAAEIELTQAIPKMLDAASDPLLRTGLSLHITHTETHAGRLEVALNLLAPSTMQPEKGKVQILAIVNLIAEGQSLMKQATNPLMRDIAIIGAARRIEHWEIAAYSELRALANLLGYIEIERLLIKTLEEERRASRDLDEATTHSVFIHARYAQIREVSQPVGLRVNGLGRRPERAANPIKPSVQP